jgi:response regulator RpfG family c-di-GMP phosphodiesterase
METQKPTALVVDDDISKANLVKLWLGSHGIKVITLYSYHESINELSNEYDYLIIDFFLDGQCTGDNFAKVNQKKYPKCKVVIYSGKPDLTNVYGVVDFGNLERYIDEIVELPEIKNKPSISKNSEILKEISKHTKQIEIINKNIQITNELIGTLKVDFTEYNKIMIELKPLLEKLSKKKDSKIKKMALKIYNSFKSISKIMGLS